MSKTAVYKSLYNRAVGGALASLLLVTPSWGAPAPAASDVQPADPSGQDKQADSEPDLAALLLGRFMMRDFRVVEGSKLRISFALYAEVDATLAAAVAEFLETHEHRVRDEVLVSIRTCDQSDFQEPDLTRMRRRVMARLQRAMPMIPIEGLLIGEFEFFND
ncbi:hypothetical protein Pla108_24830 [Botrimarina colliarenosi]|uniref:Flagellar protein FliL n=1 Tax=Botrimarina colliarenosi TaxID=2528001 RepID=A0A5C6AAW4_9BACT|nr:flagellar basal body-associated FliL family protein [Botrimarina colliarenosi]TWT96709.1 hypothetical protein Pla108_24830 [Botrimarina colliarenosi]